MDGTKLRAARERRGMSQRELGEQVGTHQTTISKIERLGWEPAGDMAAGIARALGVSPNDLAGNGTAPYRLPVRSLSASGREPVGRMPTPRLAPRNDPRVQRMLAGLKRGQRPAPPVPRAPTYYRCPYCNASTHTEEDAVRHAIACDPAYPGYSEVRVRYVDLREGEPESGRKSLRDVSRVRA